MAFIAITWTGVAIPELVSMVYERLTSRTFVQPSGAVKMKGTTRLAEAWSPAAAAMLPRVPWAVLPEV